jgi:MFS family permease
MPLDVFSAPTFSALIVVVTLSYMTVGICMWYTLTWQQVIRDLSVLQCGVNFLPFGIGSVAAVALSAYLLPRIAAQWIMAIGVVCVFGASLLLASQPAIQSYWPQTFPATVLVGFCPDFVYLAAQIIASNSVSRRHQGVASSLIGTLNQYGNALGLGVAATIESQIVKSPPDGASTGEAADLENVPGYRAALYFGAGIAAVSLLLDFVFVRVPKNDREGWDEELEDVEPGVVVASSVQRPSAA